MKKLTLIIADDHYMIRRGIKSLLQEREGIYIFGEAVNGVELIDKYFTCKPDLIIVDISMPILNGLDAVRQIKERDNNVKALFLSMYEGEEYMYYCYKSGGNGLINKNVIEGELFLAINKIINGELYFGLNFDVHTFNQVIHKYEEDNESSLILEIPELTDNETKTLKLISQGFTSSEIADKLNVSKRSVDHYRSEIMTKLKINNLPSLIKFAVKFSSINK
ncbi:MAG: response regulator transcription factor [Ignavibacteriales bacterium]|nr:response regulator transcription factor [Ignavibacteriales bacterium]